MSEAPVPFEEMLSPSTLDPEQLQAKYLELKRQTQMLERSVQKSEERRRALMHILSDLNAMNRKLNDQRKAMIHILADYEQDRRRLEKQTERLDNSRRALMHILQDSHQSNLRLENSRKAMIHIMSDLRETTEEVKRREQELREKQEQLVQAGKLATLGELTTGIAHELNNPLNNIGLFIGNAMDLIALGSAETAPEQILHELSSAMQQVRKATEIISHLRIFGRAAPVSYEPVVISQVIFSSISLIQEQLRLRQIEVQTHMPDQEVVVIGNAIQLEQVFLNLLTNARDALTDMPEKRITITCTADEQLVEIRVGDTGPGISPEIEQRIFDPFFTTKEVGAGTGLGLSITYSIIQEHQGTVTVENHDGGGALFLIQLPRARETLERDLFYG
ncbi:MAG TPA: ATP-binding protein [Ktedonobacteraceae bacterium]|jgi:C4-dicarboxylate-specific signal transduction histidine kinase|nr:ATP-binding protein [Ktedonobacteraceae bacterium]